MPADAAFVKLFAGGAQVAGLDQAEAPGGLLWSVSGWGGGCVALLPASAVFGVGLAYLRSRTRSVYPGIVLHVLFNALGVATSAVG